MPKNEDHSPIDSLIRDWGDVRVHIGFDVDLEKSDALQALDALTTGPGSLEAVAGTLRGIASDVTACSQAHTLADGKAAPVNGLVGPVDVRAFDAGLLQLALGSSAVAQFPTISALLASSTMGGWVLYKLVEDSEDGQAAVDTSTAQVQGTQTAGAVVAVPTSSGTYVRIAVTAGSADEVDTIVSTILTTAH